MSVLVALVIVGSAPSAPDPLEHTDVIYNQRGPRAAAAYAMAAFARTELPRETRLQLALSAQSAYASLYRPTDDAPPGAPEDLCRALEILALADPLVATPQERAVHDDWLTAHRTALKQDHPAHRCPSAAEAARPGPESKPSPPAPQASPTPQTSPTPRTPPPLEPSPIDRRVVALNATGGASLGLGLASLVVMASALAARSNLDESIESHKAQLMDAASLDPALSGQLSAWVRTYDVLGRLAVGTGITASVMFITGGTLLARGQVLRKRMRAAPTVGPGFAGVTLSGRF